MLAAPKLFLIRFPPGAAGKIILTLLQTSNEIAIWNHRLQSLKNTNKFDINFLDYVDQKFPKNHVLHLRNEPEPLLDMSNYYSGSFSRGNDISAKQFINYHKNDEYFNYLINNNLYLSFGIMKTELPLFCYDAKILNVSVDSIVAKKFLHRARLAKHFTVNKNIVTSLNDHPDYCSKFRKEKAAEYFDQNQPIYKINNWNKFVKGKIINVNHPLISNSIEKIINSENKENNYIFSLSRFLDIKQSTVEIKKVFDYFNLTGFNQKLINEAYGIWYDRNKNFFLRYNN